MPKIPHISDFYEINIRIYVVCNNKPIFLAKVKEFNTTGELPFNKTGMSECMIDDVQLQKISGFSELVTEAEKRKNAVEKSSSLTDQVNNAASSQSVQTTQTYSWQGGELWSDRDGCTKAAIGETPSRYMVEQQYLLTTVSKVEINGEVNESSMTHTTHSISGVEEEGGRKHTTMVSSIKLGGEHFEGFVANLSISMNNMEDPTFTYMVSDVSGFVSFSDVAMTKGIYDSSEGVNLPGGKMRKKSYSGAALAGIHRSKNGLAHGEQVIYNKSYGDTVMCFENGVLVQTSTCEKF